MTQNSEPKTQNRIDYHCHLLPALDDGAADMAEAVDIARSLARNGFTEVCCTPHLIRGFHEPDSHLMAAALRELQERLDNLGIGLRLHTGREYYLDEFLLDLIHDPVTLAGGDCVLVEIPRSAIPKMVKDTLYRLRCTGYTPLIAHPERCNLLELPAPRKRGLMDWFRRGRSAPKTANSTPCTATPHSQLKTKNSEPSAPSLLNYLKDLDCLFQGNIGSFAGIYGERVRRRAVRFLESGLYSCLGSDAHSVRNLDELLDKGLREIERIAGTDGLRRLLAGTPTGKA
jgi:protein-tyrosine phosphatase